MIWEHSFLVQHVEFSYKELWKTDHAASERILYSLVLPTAASLSAANSKTFLVFKSSQQLLATYHYNITKQFKVLLTDP